MTSIYVGNLPYQLEEEELRETFSGFGEVTSAKIVMDRDTGKPKGFGFVEMAVDEEAEAAIEGLDGSDLKGRSIRVNKARPRPDRPRHPRRF
ncbi:MAG: RNA-binding protein [Chromatiales bacterium]|jgi:RNA recognition motif-containing protein